MSLSNYTTLEPPRVRIRQLVPILSALAASLLSAAPLGYLGYFASHHSAHLLEFAAVYWALLLAGVFFALFRLNSPLSKVFAALIWLGAIVNALGFVPLLSQAIG